jgi:hypothetical protein
MLKQGPSQEMLNVISEGVALSIRGMWGEVMVSGLTG